MAVSFASDGFLVFNVGVHSASGCILFGRATLGSRSRAALHMTHPKLRCSRINFCYSKLAVKYGNKIFSFEKFAKF